MCLLNCTLRYYYDQVGKGYAVTEEMKGEPGNRDGSPAHEIKGLVCG
jgi:hypothetical protein